MKMFKVILVAAVMVVSGSAFAQTGLKGADALRAAQESNAFLLQTLRETKAKSLSSYRRDCDEEPDKGNCVPKCNIRASDGDCLSYGADVCGVGVVCVESCNIRASDGDCLSYGPDKCF